MNDDSSDPPTRQKRNPNRIREIRTRRHWNQPELAERVGAHWVTISKLERGQMQLTHEWMDRLSNALGVSPAELISDSSTIRTVYLSGRVLDYGVVEDDTWDGVQSAVPFDIDFGVREPEVTEWLILGTEAFYPYYQAGYLLRFSYQVALDLKSTYRGMALIVAGSPNPAKYVGLISPGPSEDSIELFVPGRPPMIISNVVDLAEMTMLVPQPRMITDDDGYPLP